MLKTRRSGLGNWEIWRNKDEVGWCAAQCAVRGVPLPLQYRDACRGALSLRMWYTATRKG